jgi:hypothetical protein
VSCATAALHGRCRVASANDRQTQHHASPRYAVSADQAKAQRCFFTPPRPPIYVCRRRPPAQTPSCLRQPAAPNRFCRRVNR